VTRSAGPDRPDAYFIPSSKKASPSGAAITDEVRSAAPISVLIITLPCLLCWFLSVVSGSAFRSQDHGTKCIAANLNICIKSKLNESARSVAQSLPAADSLWLQHSRALAYRGQSNWRCDLI